MLKSSTILKVAACLVGTIVLFRYLDLPTLSFNSDSETVKSHKLCVVVPYRDAWAELKVFVPYMSRFLKEQHLDFVIVVVNQMERLRFNRGALINVGSIESEIVFACDYMAMHDVDLLPRNPFLSYKYPKWGNVHHVASPEYHPLYSYPSFVGGILLVNFHDYKRLRGMSNRFWGWGLEDDEFQLRLRHAHINITRPKNLSTNSSTTFLDLHESSGRSRDQTRPAFTQALSGKRDILTGVDNIEYDIVGRQNLTIQDFPFIVLNVILRCRKDVSPWCRDGWNGFETPEETGAIRGWA